jgi:hypothetical protein
MFELGNAIDFERQICIPRNRFRDGAFSVTSFVPHQSAVGV